MRILFVIHDFLPYTFAGSEVYTFKLAKEIQALGHEVMVFCRNMKLAGSNQKELKIKKEKYKGIEVYSIFNNFQRFNTTREYYQNRKVDYEFVKLLDEFNPSIVHFQHLHTLSINFIDIARSRGIKTVMTLHDYWSICHKIQLLKPWGEICTGPGNGIKCLGCIQTGNKRIDKIFFLLSKLDFLGGILFKYFKYIQRTRFREILRIEDVLAVIERPKVIVREINKIDLLIAPSIFLKKILTENGVNKNKIIFSDYGIDTASFRKIKKERKNDGHRKKKEVIFGYIGSIVKHKGLHILYDGYKRLPEEIKKKIKVEVYGDYNNKESKSYLDLYKIKPDRRFKLLGRFDNSKVVNIFSKIDCLIVPSIWYENSPITIHEAIASNTPVIGSNIGGIAELVKRHNCGWLFKINSSSELAKLMEMLVSNKNLLIRKQKFMRLIKAIKEDAEQIIKIYKRLIKD